MRGEYWRDHLVRSAERTVAQRWLGQLRERLRSQLADWQAVRRERQTVHRLLNAARHNGDVQRIATLTPLAERTAEDEAAARRRYQVVAKAVLTETHRVCETIIEVNQQHLAQMSELQASMNTVIDQTLGLSPDDLS
ncbi:hypothetical protein ACIBF1_20685 [Spirillospora sp. NPDC050679]